MYPPMSTTTSMVEARSLKGDRPQASFRSAQFRIRKQGLGICSSRASGVISSRRQAFTALTVVAKSQLHPQPLHVACSLEYPKAIFHAPVPLRPHT